jgi:protein TonB
VETRSHSVIQNQNIWDKEHNDLVFEDRNRSYGAYRLRSLYPRHVFTGFLVAVSALLLLFYAQDIIEWIKGQTIYDTNMQIVNIINMPPPPEVLAPEYYTPPVEKHDVHLLPRVTQDSVPAPKKETEVVKIQPSTDTAGTTANNTGSNPGADSSSQSGDAGLFMKVDKLPEFPGGKEALRQFIQQNIQYPQQEKIKNHQGTVRVKCIVEEDGRLTDLGISAGLSPELNAEALRLVSIMPPWKPALVNNRPHRVWMIIPITFALRK